MPEMAAANIGLAPRSPSEGGLNLLQVSAAVTAKHLLYLRDPEGLRRAREALRGLRLAGRLGVRFKGRLAELGGLRQMTVTRPGPSKINGYRQN